MISEDLYSNIAHKSYRLGVRCYDGDFAYFLSLKATVPFNGNCIDNQFIFQKCSISVLQKKVIQWINGSTFIFWVN